MKVVGADTFNLDLIQQLCRRDWEITVVAALPDEHVRLPDFTRATPDVFVLDRFLPEEDFPRFVHYLAMSRNVDVVLISQTEAGYTLLPYLRARCPHISYVDFCHLEVEDWLDGGYARLSVENREHLDLSIVSSEHLKQWMVSRGADAGRVAVCHTNVD